MRVGTYRMIAGNKEVRVAAKEIADFKEALLSP